MSWWWMSFVGEQGFLGVCIVQAQDHMNAVTVSHMLGCNPGGEVHMIQIPPEHEAETFARFRPNRLITEEELKASKWAVRLGDALPDGTPFRGPVYAHKVTQKTAGDRRAGISDE